MILQLFSNIYIFANIVLFPSLPKIIGCFVLIYFFSSVSVTAVMMTERLHCSSVKNM